MNDKEEWNKGVNHPLQSFEWGEFRKLRQPVSRVAEMQVMWSKIPLTSWFFGYVPMGNKPRQEDIELLRQEGKKMGAVGIRFEPNVQKGEEIFGLVPGRSLFKKKTIILNLTKGEEELLKNMHPKGRYNIKVAQKHKVSVGVSVSDEDFQEYLNLMFKGTAARQKIYSHGENYHRQLWNSLKNNMAYLFVAKYQGKTLVADIVFGFKDTIYYAYGASALENKEVMAPTLLLWEIIKWGKKEGYKKFDLWGAEEGKGFTRFKEQFGGKTVETVGSYDLPVNILLYKLFRFFEEIRWKVLRILK